MAEANDQANNAPKSHAALARKYRPQVFAELIGQDAMVRTLRNAFATGRVAQAYMLTGVRGVGKTTTARLIARSLNYEGPNGEGATLDITEEGAHCRAILESRHLDHVEMTALQNRAAMGALFGDVEGGAFAIRAFVVERACDEPGGRGLADAAHAGEHVGLGDAAGGKSVAQRPHHGVLTDQLGKDLRAVFAGQRRVALRSVVRLIVGFSHLGDRTHARGSSSCPDLIRASMPFRLQPVSMQMEWIAGSSPAMTTLPIRSRTQLEARWEAERTTRETLVRAASFRI